MNISKRIKACGVVPIDGDGILVRELLSASEPTSYYAGVSSCGLVNQCPVCGSKIRATYAVKVSEEVAACLEAGGSVHHLTLTLPHGSEDRLRDVLRDLDAGWGQVKSGGAWTRMCQRIGYIGTERAEEYTWSFENGFHPHFHVLIFTDRPLCSEDHAALDEYFHAKWEQGVTACGRVAPHERYGVKFQPNVGGDVIAQYVTKVQEGDWTIAQEITRTDVKAGHDGDHITPFEIADAFFETGDIEYSAAWNEFVSAVKGRCALRASNGLRKKLGLDEDTRTDEELAAAELEGDKRTVAVISVPVWHRVLAAELDHDVLLASERAGLAGINQLLAAHGCGWANPPPEAAAFDRPVDMSETVGEARDRVKAARPRVRRPGVRR